MYNIFQGNKLIFDKIREIFGYDKQSDKDIGRSKSGGKIIVFTS